MLRAEVADGDRARQGGRAYMDAGELVPDEVIVGMIDQRLVERGRARRLPARRLSAQQRAGERARGGARRARARADRRAADRRARRRGRAPAGGTARVREEPQPTSTTSSSTRPSTRAICDQDGSRLVQRDDDREETIRHRLAVYHARPSRWSSTTTLCGLLRRFDGRRSPDEVHDHIRATVATLRLEEELVERGS